MKTFIPFLCIFFSVVGVSPSTAQILWEKVLPTSSEEANESMQYYYSSVSCSDENNCTVIGNEFNKGVFPLGLSHLIQRTTNGGKDWVAQGYGLPKFSFWQDAQYVSVTAIDSLHIFATGDSGKVLKTTDAGLTWLERSIMSSSDMVSAHFFDSNNGIFVGWSGTFATTKDGGESFNTLEGQSYTGFNSCVSFDVGKLGKSYYMSDEFHGRLYKYSVTGDGAYSHFDSVSIVDTSWDGTKGSFIRDIHFFDTLNGMAVGGHQGPDNISQYNFRAFITKTTDAGKSWEVVYDRTMHGSRELMCISFSNEKIGAAFGGSKYFLITTDGGNTWREDSIVVEEPFDIITSVSFKDKSIFVTARSGFHGYVFKGSLLMNSVENGPKTNSSQLVLSPNPVISDLSIKLDGISGVTYSIIDGLGRSVLTGNITSGSNFSVNCEELPSGFYILTIHSKDGRTYSERFIKN